MITAIVAVAENYAIGKDGRLPWHYPADLRFFKQTTSGKAVVMGRRTWESIGRPLPNRLNIVLSRDTESLDDERCLLIRERSQVLSMAGYLKDDLIIIGGAGVYKSFADDIERWIVTRIPRTVDDADAFMPADFLDDFSRVSTVDLGDGLSASIYERVCAT